MVRNKAHVEGSICEAYNIQEIAHFTSFYFESTLSQTPRNDDGGDVVRGDGLSIFSFPGRPLTQNEAGSRFLKDEELRTVRCYVLLNCEEVKDMTQ